MGIQLFYGCLLGCSKRAIYRSLKVLLIASTISLPIQQTANSSDEMLGILPAADSIGDPSDNSFELWSFNTTEDTKTLLQSFQFDPEIARYNLSGSFVDANTGKLWLQSGDSYTVYDVATDTITHEVGGDVISSIQGLGPCSGVSLVGSYSAGLFSANCNNLALFVKPIAGGTDSLISAETSTSAIVVDESNSTIKLNDGAIADASGDNIISMDSDTGVVTLGSGADLVQVTGGGIADASGDNIIKKESDGSVHIGTNSFITREFGGKQEIYATNAAGGAIDLNVTNGSDLLVNGASVMGSIRGLTALSTAFSSVPNDSEESRYQCGLGFGRYDGKMAIASGCAMRLSNFTMGGERFDVSVNAAASYLPSGSDYLGNMPSTAIRAGVSIKFGSSTPNNTAFKSSAGNSSASYLRQLSSARREIADLQNKVADLETLKDELVEIKLMIASLASMQTTAMR